jgi:hypothetical protein
MMKSEIRNPKSEGMANAECRMACPALVRPAVRASGFGLLSSFGIRHSEFSPEVAR